MCEAGPEAHCHSTDKIADQTIDCFKYHRQKKLLQRSQRKLRRQVTKPKTDTASNQLQW
jgi:hypothetical protein